METTVIDREDVYDAAIRLGMAHAPLYQASSWGFIDGFLTGVNYQTTNVEYKVARNIYGITVRTNDGVIGKLVFEKPILIAHIGQYRKRMESIIGFEGIIFHRTPTKIKNYG